MTHQLVVAHFGQQHSEDNYNGLSEAHSKHVELTHSRLAALESAILPKEGDLSLTVSRKLVLEQQYYFLSQLERANDTLDAKIMSLFQVTGLIAFAGIFIFPDLAIKNVLFSGLFALMVILMVYVLVPKDTYIPGTQDWDKLYEQYVYKGADDCFDQILSDGNEAGDMLLARNQSKSKVAFWAIALFGSQIIGLVIIAWFEGMV